MRDPAAHTGTAAPIDWTARLSQRAARQPDLLGDILALANATNKIDFSGGFPDTTLSPTETLEGIVHRLLAEDTAVALQYAPSEGIAGTRAAVADWLHTTDGLRPADNELMITSGGIDAVTLIAKSMLDPGDVVVAEEPSYLGAVAGFTSFDAQLRGVPLDHDGLDVEAVARLLASLSEPPKLLYTIPDFQNPSGRTTSVDRRHALVELCRRYGVLIVEDVAYSQLAFDPGPRPSLWSLAPDIVVQIGTFSKIFFPGVRMGWAAGPAAIVAPLVVAKQNSDQCSGALGQRMVEEFLRGGHLDTHLPKIQNVYRRRGAAMETALAQHFQELGGWTTPRGGFFSWLRLPGVDTAELAKRADVAFVPGAGFFCEHPDDEYLRLSFSRWPESEIDLGIQRLAAIVRGAR
jgi:2-aminoadipate transaminase